MKDLQQLINERVEKRLEKEIKSYISQLRNHPFWDAIRELTMQTETKNESLHTAFWISNGFIFRKIKEHFLPMWIEDASIEILQKIENLEEEEE